MNMRRFNGYPLALRTRHSPQECHLRLVTEFHGTNAHAGGFATSDKRLLGWQEGGGFVIYPWPYHSEALYRRTFLSSRIDTSRSCRLRVQPHADGALISGRYTYTSGEGLLLFLVIGLLFGIIAGLLLVVAGSILAFQTPQALWPLALGASILGVCVWLISNTRDGDFTRERDYIARYLARVLEAEPIDAPAPRRSGTLNQRQRTGTDW